jgi:lysophospholipase L1-like esterase
VKKVRTVVVVLAFVLTSLMTVFSESAVASSDYDNVIATGGELELYLPVNNDGMGRCSEPYLTVPKSNDLRTTWTNYLLDPANYTTSTLGAEGAAFWQNLLDDPEEYGWSAAQYTAPSTSPPAGYKTIIITASTTRGAEFTTAYGYNVLRTTGTDTRTYYIDYYSYGNPNIRCDVHIGYWNNYGKAYIANEANASVEKSVFINYDIDYPTGYEGVYAPTTQPPAKYVAMGDSFSSGEGNAPFEAGTDEDDENECHRSPDAYPRLLQADSSLSLGATAFVACSGATTNQVKSGGTTNGAWGEDSQVHFLSPDTDVVTITVGGNNIKFSEFANTCVYGSCASSSSEYQESWDILTDLTRTDYLPSQLESLFSDMSSELWLNTTVKVYVVGYPYLITQASWEDRGVGICSDFDEDEASAAEALVLKLDSIISTAVTDFDDSRFVYVDPLATGSPFLGHELCRGGSYFRGTEAGLDDPVYVFHPNEDGQQAYAELIESNMS